MSAERLRQAADRLDALAEAAEPGPWFVVRIPGHTDAADVGTTDDPDEGMGVCCGTLAQPSCDLDDAAYIATMHPPVGKGLAKVLRGIAADFTDEQDYSGGDYVSDALAVADAIVLGDRQHDDGEK